MRGISLFAFAVIVMLAASQPANAGGGHRHSHARFGIVIGTPLVFSPWWGPSYYPAPPVVVRERVVVREPLVYYDEHGNPVPPTAPPQPQASAPAPAWYFCPDSQTYYPYVRTCPSPWQRVVPHPPPQ